MRRLLLLSLLILTGCAGGYYDTSGNQYHPQYRQIYDPSTGKTIWVNEMCCSDKNWQAPYMDYNTGKTYYPSYDSNSYVGSDGQFYQAY